MTAAGRAESRVAAAAHLAAAGRRANASDEVIRRVLAAVGLDDIKPRPRRNRGGRPHGTLAPHGTWAAYMRHLRHGEPPCEPCQEAARQREHDRDRSERVRIHIGARNKR